MDAGCDWDMSNGPDAAALMELHIPPDQYAEHHISRDALEASGERALANVKGSGTIFGPFIPKVIIDPD
jgi:hypothetical protein